MVYGYHRTSTKEQHLDRGIAEITKYCEEHNMKLEKVYTDQQTGKNFERARYIVLTEDQSIMEEEKPNQKEKPTFRDERITKLIPKTVPRGQETDFVVKALEFYNRHLGISKRREYYNREWAALAWS